MIERRGRGKIPFSMPDDNQWLKGVIRNFISARSKGYSKICKAAFYTVFFRLGADKVSDGIIDKHFMSAVVF